MKILWFSPSPCGSLGRSNSKAILGGWLFSLEKALKDCPEVDLHVAFLSPGESESFVYDGVTYHPILQPVPTGALKRIIHRHKSLRASGTELLPAMTEIVERVAPDLIHIHGTEQAMGLVASKVTNIPVVFSIQGLLNPLCELYWSGIPAEFSARHDSWVNRIRGISRKLAYEDFKRRAKREAAYLKDARYIFGRTDWDRHVTHLLSPASQYYQAEELMRPEFYENQWTQPKDESVFRIVTTISDGVYKGFETLLHAAALLKDSGTINFEWVVIGLNAHNRVVKLCEQLTGLKADECNIRFTGRLNAEQMIDVLLKSHLYCNSSHIENSPNNVCEAMLMGMPLIASYAGGTVSITGGDDSMAWLYQAGDSFSLAGSILDVYEHFPQAVERGLKARQVALHRHDVKATAKEYIENYKNVITDFKNKKK